MVKHIQGWEETFQGDGQVYHTDWNDGFTVHTYLQILMCMCTLTVQLFVKKVKIKKNKEKVTVENPTNQWWGSETRPGGTDAGAKGQVLEREKENGKKQKIKEKEGR